ncbi:MAG: hypothetical protein KAW56_14250 [Candidatus Marinimicrobia bacterium]|nr:hypothetical protein [candidate division WOR-3 bacterium]MCK4448229.1 hypothetical protein [Candidatus Neomarinimicrobiota bacterium]
MIALSLYAEKYSDEQVKSLYEIPPYGEPRSLDNHFIIGPLGIGKTILMKNMAIRLLGTQNLAIYVDLSLNCIPEIGEELPLEIPENLFPYQFEYRDAAIAALDRAIIGQTLDSLSKAGLEASALRSEVARLLDVNPDNITLEKIVEEINELRLNLQAGTTPSSLCLGARPLNFSVLCESISNIIKSKYRKSTVFFLDQLDQIRPILQEYVTDVFRREFMGTYFIASRPFPAAPKEIQNLMGHQYGDFTTFRATFNGISLEQQASFLQHLARKIKTAFDVSFPEINQEILQTLAWISGESTRTAVNLLLELHRLSELQNVKISSPVVEQAVTQVSITEAKLLQSEARWLIPETKRILSRWTTAFELKSIQENVKYKSFHICFDSDKFPNRVADWLRILIRGNILKYAPGETWSPGELPIKIALNPCLLAGTNKFHIMDAKGKDTQTEEKIKDITGYFKSTAFKKDKKRRIQPGKAKVFVSLAFPDSSIKAVHKSKIVSLLESESKGLYQVITGVGSTGKIIDEIEKRIKTSHLMVIDLTMARPDILFELGLGIGSKVPVIFTVANAADRKDLPEIILNYGVFTYIDTPDDFIAAVRTKLDTVPTPKDKWLRGGDGDSLYLYTRIQNILCITPQNISSAQDLFGSIQTVAKMNNFEVKPFQPNPDINVAIDELVRHVYRAPLILIDLAGISSYEYSVFALIASGLAYRRRYRYLTQKLRKKIEPVIYSSTVEGKKLIPTMLQTLVIKGSKVNEIVVEKVNTHCNKFRWVRKENEKKK